MVSNRDIKMHVWDAARLQGKAHGIVARAKMLGFLPVLDGSIYCVDCGKVASDYDHRNYFEPLSVEPVCRSCNLHRGSAYPFTVEIPHKITGRLSRYSSRQWLFIPEKKRLVTVYARRRIRQTITAEMFLHYEQETGQ